MMQKLKQLEEIVLNSSDESDDLHASQRAASKVKAENPFVASRPIEIIELTPVQELTDKLQVKKLLTKEELNALSLILGAKFSDVKSKIRDVKILVDFVGTESQKLSEVLNVVYHAILNSYSYSYCQNYLEQAAYIKISKEALQLSKRVLESISKKDSDPLVYKSCLPIIMKIITTLSIKKNLEQNQYQYVRKGNLRLETTHLAYLNEYLAETFPSIWGLNKSNKPALVQVKAEDQPIALPQQNIGEDEDLDRVLDFVPPDYSAMTDMMNKHLQGKMAAIEIKEEDTSMQEDEDNLQASQEGREYLSIVKDFITKLKLNELLSKVLDKLPGLVKKELEVFQIFSPSLYSKILQTADQLDLKLKKLPAFLTDELLNKLLEAQTYISRYPIESSQQMQVDQSSLEESQQKGHDFDILKEHLLLLSKGLDLLIKLGVSHQTPNITGKLFENVGIIFKEAQDFRYLILLLKDLDKKHIAQLSQGILSITYSTLQYYYNLQKFGKDKEVSIEHQLIVVTTLMRVIKNFKEEVKIKVESRGPSSQPQVSQEKSSPAKTGNSTTMKTRGQIKKEQESVKKEETKKKSVDRTEESKSIERQPSNQKRRATILNINYNLDSLEVFKSTLSFVSMILPKYLTIESEISMPRSLVNNLIELSQDVPAVAQRLVFGVLSQFSKGQTRYTKETQNAMIEGILKKTNHFGDQQIQAIFTMKLLLLFKNEDFAQRLASSIIEHEWQENGKKQIKSLTDVFEHKNLNKFLIFILCMIQLSSTQKKKLIADQILAKITNDHILFYFLLLSLTLLQKEVLNKHLKKVISTFIIKLDESQLTITSEVDKAINGIIGLPSENQIFNKELLAGFAGQLNIQSMSQKIKGLKGDVKILIKLLLRINTEIGSQDSRTLVDFSHELKMQDLPVPLLNYYTEKCLVNSIQQAKNDLTQMTMAQVNIVQELTDVLVHQFNFTLASIIAKSIDNGTENGFAQLITEFVKITSFSIKAKVNAQIVHINAEEKQLATLAIDQQVLVKQLAGLNSSNDEDRFQAHYLSQAKDEQQKLVSVCLLIKSVYTNLYSLLNLNLPDQQTSTALAMLLLKLKYECPFLEYSETTMSFDQDMSDKILQKSGSVNIANKDFLRLRQLDQCLGVLASASTFLSNPVLSDVKNLILTLSQETMNSFNLSSFKASEIDYQLIQDYFNLRSPQALADPLQQAICNSDFFNKSLKHNKVQIWDLAMQFLVQVQEQKIGDESVGISEKKGGISINIPVKSGAFHGKGSAGKRAGAARKKSELKEQPAQVTTEVKREISPIAQKLLNNLIEVLNIDKDLASTSLQQRISNHFREAFLSSSCHQIQGNDSFVSTLVSLNQIPLLKKVFSALLHTMDTNLRQALAQSLTSLLVKAIDPQNDDTIVMVVELAQQLANSSKDLLIFIKENILPLIQPNGENEYSYQKLSILDFIMQLTQSRYQTLNDQSGSQNYNVTAIIDQRKQLLKDKQEALQIKRRKAAVLNQEDTEFGTEKKSKRDERSQIAGFREDKVSKDEDNKHYMERPEEVCTYTQTKKDFKLQHWYYCYTCNLTGSNGCCAVCATKCHKDHYVVYMKKSNFFCDCGDSGNCKSLQKSAAADQDRPKKRQREQEPSDKGLLFKGQPPSQPLSSFGLFGIPPPNLGNPFGGQRVSKFDPDEMEDEEYEMLQENAWRNPPPFQFNSESSEERDIHEDELGLLEDDDQNANSFRSMSKIMHMIQQKEREMGGYRGRGGYRGDRGRYRMHQDSSRPKSRLSARKKESQDDLSENLSQMSKINPIEDPLSEGGSTPSYQQVEAFQLSQNPVEGADTVMEDLSQNTEIVELVQQDAVIYEEVYKYLMRLIDSHVSQGLSQTSHQEISLSGLRKKESERMGGFIQAKTEAKLIQDHSTLKKQFKENTFQFKFNDQTKSITYQELNLMAVIDSNKDGLVAIIENDQEVSLYAGSQFFEDSQSPSFETFSFETKEGQAVNKIDSDNKFSFQPVMVKFNPAQPYYLCVAGTKNVDVLSINKQGKIVQKITIDLLLEVLNKDLTLANVHWVPGQQTLLAVGTREFVKVYDLSEDTICPTHNFMIFNGYIADFTFGDTTIQQDGSMKSTIYVASKGGAVYYQEVIFRPKKDNVPKENQMQFEDNSDIMLTRTLSFDNQLVPGDNNAFISCHYSQDNHILYLSLQGGALLGGIANHETGTYSGFRINPAEDASNQGSNMKTLLQKYGDCFCQLRDFRSNTSSKKGDQSKVYLQAISRKVGQANTGVPVVFEISDTFVEANIFRATTSGSSITPVYGFALVQNSNKLSNQARFFSLANDGTGYCHSYLPLVQEQSDDLSSSINKIVNLTQMIQKSDLPKDVKLPINFFEKMKNILGSENNFKQKLSMQGELMQINFKTSKVALEILSKQNPNPVVNEATKKSIKFSVRLETSSDHILVGLRLKLDLNPIKSGGSLSNISLKIFNRVYRFKVPPRVGNSQQIQLNNILWHDIGFCEVESMYTTLNNGSFEAEIITDDPKLMPIRIYAMEFFATSKKEFGYKEKIKSLEKIGNELKETEKGVDLTALSQDEAIHNELGRTKGMPVVTWKEKINSLKNEHTDVKNTQLVYTLDIISQFMHVDSRFANQELVEKIKSILKQAIIGESQESKLVVPAIKRILQRTVQILNPVSVIGDPMNYQTIKDQIIVESLIQKLLTTSFSDLEDLRHFLTSLAKIQIKRPYQIFKIIESNPNLVCELSTTYLRLFKSVSAETSNDLKNMISLIIGEYQQKVNQICDHKASSIIESMRQCYGQQELSETFVILKPYIMHQDEQVQKLTVSHIISQLKQYSMTVAKILKYNQLPINVHYGQAEQKSNLLILDFAPHLLMSLLNFIIQHKDQADLFYSLSYKMVKLFEQNCMKGYGDQGKELLPSIAQPLANFIFKSLTAIDTNQIYEQSKRFENQHLYSNLILINLILQESQKDSHAMKFKQSDLSLDKLLKESILTTLKQDQGQVVYLTKWVISTLQQFAQGFKDDKCSYRIKYDEGIPVDVHEHLAHESANSLTGLSLLRPIQETASWKWHPLFVNAEGIFDLLDRKVPAQLLLSIQFIMTKLGLTEALTQDLITVVRDIALRKPSSKFLQELGENSIKQLMLTQVENPTDENTKKKIDQELEKKVKSIVVFQEFNSAFSPIFEKYLKRKQPMTFNMQFQIHNLLANVWNQASQSPQNWGFFIQQQHEQSTKSILNDLFESSFILNEDSSLLCLLLCALALNNEEQSIVAKTYKQIQNEVSFDMFRMFQKPKDLTLISNLNFNFNKLIDVQLLGRNKKSLRITSAYLVKGLYDQGHKEIVKVLLEKFNTIQTFGVNSYEFISVVSYIVNQEAANLTDLEKTNISSLIFRGVDQTNQSLTAHPNLEIYATLQRISSFFHGEDDIFDGSFKQFRESLIQIQKQADQYSIAPQGPGRNRKITNPYMLETEVCSKCSEQKSQPYTNQRLNDVKAEAKFTDSTLVYKLNGTYLIKQIQINLHELKGVKVIKTLNIYVNVKQGIDLADMKNNWNHWKRVKLIEVDVAQKNIIVDFTLPVNASNILIEFQTVNLSKPMTGKERTQQVQGQKESVSVTGIDSVLQILPRDILSRIGAKSSNSADIIQGSSIIDGQNMNCPRCGKNVQSKHGVCNSCGENALQCTFCRNINYEKPDGFLCNECGFSRFCKFDVSLVLKPGYACEKIENEDQKNSALQQIESHLQIAQQSYQVLMKRRTTIANLVKKVNEGMDGARMINEIYGEECSDAYQKIIKSLNTVKALKIELEQFTGMNGQPVAQEQPSNQSALRLTRSTSRDSNQPTQDQQCFSCSQEYLKSLLNFLQTTASDLNSQYKEQGFIKVLTEKNIKMHSAQLQLPARLAICSLVEKDEQQTLQILDLMQRDIFEKNTSVPAHMLSQTISQQAQLIIDLLQSQLDLKHQQVNNFAANVFKVFWRVLFKSLSIGQQNASVADQVGGRFLAEVKDLIKQKDQEDLAKTLIASFKASSEDIIGQREYFQDKNFLIEALILLTSQRSREQAMEILNALLAIDKSSSIDILSALLKVLPRVLNLSSPVDQYYDMLTILLNPAQIKEKLAPSNISEGEVNTPDGRVYVEAFETLFKKIDSELNKLVVQENQRQLLGADGFMPQLSTGVTLSRIVQLISTMVKESDYLKNIIQRNVSVVIKSFLRIRKLNLTKNKIIQNSEVEIEKMFKELHSNKEDDKGKFIQECIKIIDMGECDLQEMRFLFEEICKVIEPVKPEPEYLLNLHKAASQEFYFRGKMSKNPYTSTSLGKTMSDVRIKICKEMELAEPELVELLVAGKIVGMDLSIKQVYEQVFWPALCKQRDPDSYEVPNIDEAPKSSLQAMNVTFRLMGIDGEATEDRVETLNDGNEADLDPANIEKKYGFTTVLTQKFQSHEEQEETNGIQVLLRVLEGMGQLHQQRYLAEWLFKLMTYCIKIQKNRSEFIRNKQTVDLFAKRLFESVGLQSQLEGQKGVTLFDIILGILEQLVAELNKSEDTDALSSYQERMDIDQQAKEENIEAATHVEIFIQIMNDSCNEMINNHQQLDKTSKKIRAVSKILPFLIRREDSGAINVIVEFLVETLAALPNLDQAQSSLSSKEKFSAKFNLERVFEILESTPIEKEFLKDAILDYQDGTQIKNTLRFFGETSMKDAGEATAQKHKIANESILKIIFGLTKNHPRSQELLKAHQILDRLYELTQAKHKDKLLTILANDVVQSLTNKNHTNEESVKTYLQRLIDQQNDEKKRLAQRKKEEIMKKMQSQKNANKFLKQIESVNLQEETGPRCVVCQDGYTKKPTEVLGVYVFNKKIKFSEVSANGAGFVQTQGYCTVTHSNFIHFLCHQNAYRADSQLKQPKKEWEGAIIRNSHTKCNNLFPIKGGQLPEDSYSQMIERYFQVLQKSIGQSDNDRLKVLTHDFKILMKRLAFEDSFSRDSQGGGPEQNMYLIPFFLQMIIHTLKQSENYKNRGADSSQFLYVEEKRLNDFLDQGLKQKQDFLQKLEEEKKADEIEEEVKFSESESSSQQDEGGEQTQETNQLSQANQIKVDQLVQKLTQCLIFTQAPKWEQHYKKKFLSIILCAVAQIKEDTRPQDKVTWQQTDYASGKKVITILNLDSSMNDEQQMDLSNVRRRRLSSDNKIDQIQKALINIRPFLVLLRLVDLIKLRWDVKRLGVMDNLNHEVYLQKLYNDFLCKGNLMEVIGECNEIFKEYKDRILKLSSVEEFLQEMGLIDHIRNEHGGVEQFVLSHF